MRVLPLLCIFFLLSSASLILLPSTEAGRSMAESKAATGSDPTSPAICPQGGCSAPGHAYTNRCNNPYSKNCPTTPPNGG